MFYETQQKWVSFWQTIGTGCAVVLLGWFFAWVLVNWVTGCGEQFPTANGSYIAGECVPFHMGVLGND